MADHCRRCAAPLVDGVAIRNDDVVFGLPDFPGDPVGAAGATCSYRSSGALHPVLKCPACGESYEPTAAPANPNKNPAP